MIHSKNEMTITLIGDSIAKGIATEGMKLTRVDTCASFLVGEYLGVEIRNLSVYGQTIRRVKEKKLIEDYIKNLDKTKNNKLVFSIGGNDADFDWQEVAKRPEGKHLSKTPENEFISIIESMIDVLKKNGVDVWITGLPPVNSERYFNNVICKITDGEKIMQFYGGDISNIQRHQELYNFLLYKLAVKTNCHFLDVRSLFLRDKEFLNKFCQDGVHPNKEGHRVLANEIIEQIKVHKKL